MQRRQATLKEKLSEHYQKFEFKPKLTSASTMGISFFVTMTVSLVIECLVVLIPSHYHEEDGTYRSGYYFAQVFILILFIETAANWWYSYNDVSNRVTKNLKSEYFQNMIETPPGWKNCPTCMIDAPPRSHHCTLCNHCILKRDHHCFFTGSCIGFYNQRSFVIYCIYVAIASTYGSYLQLAYLDKEYPLFSSSAINYFPLLAMWNLLSGIASLGFFIVLVHLCLTLVCCGGSVFFLGWQLLVIYRGQTSHEAWKQIMIYRRQSVFSNFYNVFGSPVHFLICLFIPVSLMLPEDGVKWTIEPKSEKGH